MCVCVLVIRRLSDHSLSHEEVKLVVLHKPRVGVCLGSVVLHAVPIPKRFFGDAVRTKSAPLPGFHKKKKE